jgi:hypothetical protein
MTKKPQTRTRWGIVCGPGDQVAVGRKRKGVVAPVMYRMPYSIFNDAIMRLRAKDGRGCEILTLTLDLRPILPESPGPLRAKEIADRTELSPARISQLRCRAWRRLLAILYDMSTVA